VLSACCAVQDGVLSLSGMLEKLQCRHFLEPANTGRLEHPTSPFLLLDNLDMQSLHDCKPIFGRRATPEQKICDLFRRKFNVKQVML
jgi:hypothetical protein